MKKLLCILLVCACLSGPALASDAESAPAPKAEEAPAPQAEAPAPKVEEAPAPKTEEAPAPKTEEAPAPKVEEAPVPKVEEAPVPQAEEAPAPDQEPPAEDGPETPAEDGTEAPAANAGQGVSSDPETPDPAAPREGEAAEETAEAGPEPTDAAKEQAPAEVRRLLRYGMTEAEMNAVIADLAKGDVVFVDAAKDKPVCLKAVSLKELLDAEFSPDDDVYKDKECRVFFSANGDGETFDDLKRLAKAVDADKADLYLWVDKPEKAAAAAETPAESAPDGDGEPAVAIRVTCEGLVSGEWTREWPVFELSGIPEGKNWSYAVIIYDERIAVLSEAAYTPEAEGVYALRFAILDELGDIVSASEKYTLMLDCTPPEEVTMENDETESYTLYISASDAVSGVVALSMDGGGTWMDFGDGDTYTYAPGRAETLPAGAIHIRDAAGNEYVSDREIKLVKIKPEPDYPEYYGGGGGGGGEGGDGEKKPVKTHASGTGEDEGDYDVLQLQLPDGPMTQLTIDDTPMPLTLALTAAEDPQARLGDAQPFEASLAAWEPAPNEEGAAARRNAAPDTLVLTAAADPNLGDRYTYEWRFNGEVYRMLANSGIRYVALQVGDDVAAFPTAGFTGGTKYTELKMLGVSTRRFDYTITMKADLDPGHVSAMSESDFSRTCDLSIRAEVENMAYELSSSTHSAMYFYDVYLGPADMLSQPFGAYQPES